jgi:DNA-binding NtrC family response regulator
LSDLDFLHESLQESGDLTGAKPVVYLVEDDQVFGKTLKKYIEKKLNIEVRYFNGPLTLIEDLSVSAPAPFCLVTDISFEDTGTDGLLLIDLLKEKGFRFSSIVMTGFASIETAITATKKGVFHYLTKPFELDVLVDLVKTVFVKQLKFSEEIFAREENGAKGTDRQISAGSSAGSNVEIRSPNEDEIFCGMIGRSPKMKKVFERIKKVSSSGSTVLINGPSGTGKELVANAIHSLSTRKNNTMVSVNCGAIPSELLESELFGHEKGSFTGAISSRKGRFELANKGTIFLDEIGDMPLLLQVKLLRVLQNRVIERVGSSEVLPVDVRIITATHRDLESEVQKGNFREDLFYRLNVIPIKVPPLSQRREDIPLLIGYFLSRFSSADGRNKVDFSPEALDILMTYDWPGNVRELENLIERFVILKGGGQIGASDLPVKFLRHNSNSKLHCDELITLPEEGINLKDTLRQIEESLIDQALAKTKGNKNQASKLLFLNRTTLIEKMKKHSTRIPPSQ